MLNLRNLSLSDYRRFLIHLGLFCTGSKGGHETWSRPGLGRPIVLQTHVDPVSQVVVFSNNRTLGLSRQAFEEEWSKCFPSKSAKSKKLKQDDEES